MTYEKTLSCLEKLVCKPSLTTLWLRVREPRLREARWLVRITEPAGGRAGTQICPREPRALHPRFCKGTMTAGTAVAGGEKGGEQRECEGNRDCWYLRSPCLLEIPSLECGTSGFGWLEGCGVRGWCIGPRRPEPFSPTGSSGSSLPRSVEMGRPLDANTRSPCLDHPVAPTRGRYLRGSRSQSPRTLGAEPQTPTLAGRNASLATTWSPRKSGSLEPSPSSTWAKPDHQLTLTITWRPLTSPHCNPWPAQALSV